MAKAEKELAMISGYGYGRALERQGLSGIWRDNVAGLATVDDFKVPYSELAMHVGAAGGAVMSWAIDGRSAWVLWSKGDGSSGWTEGLASELLTSRVRELSKNMFGKG